MAKKDDNKEQLIECHVLSPLKHNGKKYGVGMTVHLTVDEVEQLTNGIVVQLANAEPEIGAEQ